MPCDFCTKRYRNKEEMLFKIIGPKLPKVNFYGWCQEIIVLAVTQPSQT